jgi:hypothetical protein
VTWNVSNDNLEIISGQGTDSITIRKNGDGLSILTASIVYDGSLITALSKSIIVGTPPFSVEITPLAADGEHGYWRSDMAGNLMEADFGESENYPVYMLDLYRLDSNFNYGQRLYHQEWSDLCHLPFDNLPQGWYSLEFSVLNGCGDPATCSVEFESIDGADLQNRMLSINYDKNSQLLTVNLKLALDKFQKELPTTMISNSNHDSNSEIQLWNGHSIVCKVKVTSNKMQIPMSGMKNGLYIVRAVKDGKILQQKLLKH